MRFLSEHRASCRHIQNLNTANNSNVTQKCTRRDAWNFAATLYRKNCDQILQILAEGIATYHRCKGLPSVIDILSSYFMLKDLQREKERERDWNKEKAIGIEIISFHVNLLCIFCD